MSEQKIILIAGDDCDAMDAIPRCLPDNLVDKIRFVTAIDSSMIMQVFEKESPELVILCLMLRRRSGFLVIDKMKKRKKPNEKPFVVVVTEIKSAVHKDYAERLGASFYLQKPLRMERLYDCIRKLLSLGA